MTLATGDVISFNEPRWGVTDKDTWLVKGFEDAAFVIDPVKIVEMRCGIRIMLPAKDKRFNFPPAKDRSRFRS